MINELIHNSKQDREKTEKLHQRKIDQLEVSKTKAVKEAEYHRSLHKSRSKDDDKYCKDMMVKQLKDKFEAQIKTLKKSHQDQLNVLKSELNEKQKKDKDIYIKE